MKRRTVVPPTTSASSTSTSGCAVRELRLDLGLDAAHLSSFSATKKAGERPLSGPAADRESGRESCAVELSITAGAARPGAPLRGAAHAASAPRAVAVVR